MGYNYISNHLMSMLLRIDPRHFGPKAIVVWLGGGLLFLFSISIYYSLFVRVHYYLFHNYDDVIMIISFIS
jgi:hypothetical protein